MPRMEWMHGGVLAATKGTHAGCGLRWSLTRARITRVVRQPLCCSQAT